MLFGAGSIGLRNCRYAAGVGLGARCRPKAVPSGALPPMPRHAPPAPKEVAG